MIPTPTFSKLTLGAHQLFFAVDGGRLAAGVQFLFALDGLRNRRSVVVVLAWSRALQVIVGLSWSQVLGGFGVDRSWLLWSLLFLLGLFFGLGSLGIAVGLKWESKFKWLKNLLGKISIFKDKTML